MEFAQAWNFGPFDYDARTVEWEVTTLCKKWGGISGYEVSNAPQPHEANYLKLDCSKAMTKLGWMPKWNVETALDKVIQWTRAYQAGQNIQEVCWGQIKVYEAISASKFGTHG